ncbi:MAG: Calx-beta domain-containing protein [Cyanobium sp.]
MLPTADSEMEGDETVALSLIEGSTYRANSTDAVVGTITNDDSPRISLSLDPAAVDEDGSANLVYRLDRTGPTTDTLVVDVAVDVAVGGTAINGVDYGSIGTSVTFAPGESFTTLTIDPLTDADIEPDETVSVSLLTGPGYTVDSTAGVVGTIRNDDWPVITLQAPPPPSQRIAAAPSAGPSSAAGPWIQG